MLIADGVPSGVAIVTTVTAGGASVLVGWLTARSSLRAASEQAQASVRAASEQAQASVRAATEQSRATIQAASEATKAEARTRFAEFQMTKRKLYWDFLAAARAAHTQPSYDHEFAYLKLREQVLLYANKAAGDEVAKLSRDPSELRLDDADWSALIEALRLDALDDAKR